MNSRGEIAVKSAKGMSKPPQGNGEVQDHGRFASSFGFLDVLVLSFLVIVGLLLLAFHQRIESFNEDSSYYIGLADSLVQKGRFEFDFRLHTQHPPGFPAMLAVVALLFGSKYSVYLSTVEICGILGLVVSYVLLRQVEGRPVAAVACLLLASSPFFFELASRGVLSELPYFLTSMITLFFATVLQAAKSLRTRIITGAALAFFLLLSIMIRSAGIALVAGIFLWISYSLVRGGWQALPRLKIFASVLILGIGLQLLWMGWVKRVVVRDWPGQYMNDYVNQMKMKDPRYPEKGVAGPVDLLRRSQANLLIEEAHFFELLSRASWIDRLWFSPAVLLPLLLIVAGCVISIHLDGSGFLVWYFLSYIGIFLLWPFDPGPRAILPVFPLAFLFFWRGMRALIAMSFSHPRGVFRSGFLFSAVIVLAAGLWAHGQRTQIGAQGKAALLFWPLLACVFGLLLWTGAERYCRDSSFSDLVSRPIFSFGRGSLTAPLLAGSCLTLFLVAVGMFQDSMIARANLNPDPTKFLQYPSVDAAQWLASNTHSTDLVMAGQEAIVYRVSGRKIIPFPVTSNMSMIMETIRHHHVAYLIILEELNQHPFFFPTEDERWHLLSEKYPNDFRLVHKGPGYAIYEIVKEYQGQSVGSPGTAALQI